MKFLVMCILFSLVFLLNAADSKPCKKVKAYVGPNKDCGTKVTVKEECVNQPKGSAGSLRLVGGKLNLYNSKDCTGNPTDLSIGSECTPVRGSDSPYYATGPCLSHAYLYSPKLYLTLMAVVFIPLIGI